MCVFATLRHALKAQKVVGVRVRVRVKVRVRVRVRVDLVLPVRDVHDRHVGVVSQERERVQQPLLVVPGETVCRLVEQQQPRLLGERAALR